MTDNWFGEEFWADVERRAKEERAGARRALANLEVRLAEEEAAGTPEFSEEFWADVERRAKEERAGARRALANLEVRLDREEAAEFSEEFWADVERRAGLLQETLGLQELVRVLVTSPRDDQDSLTQAVGNPPRATLLGKAALPDVVDDEDYERIRKLMRLCVVRVWGSDHVITGMDPWVVVDEAWSSMAQLGFRSDGPFLPFAIRVARNKALDARIRAEARRRVHSLDEPLPGSSDDPEGRVLADVTTRSPGADAEYFSKLEHLDAIQRLAWAEEAIYGALSDAERSAFLAVRVAGKSRDEVGRELDPSVTGQRVGQVIAAATIKIRNYIEERVQEALVDAFCSTCGRDRSHDPYVADSPRPPCPSCGDTRLHFKRTLVE